MQHTNTCGWKWTSSMLPHPHSPSFLTICPPSCTVLGVKVYGEFNTIFHEMSMCVHCRYDFFCLGQNYFTFCHMPNVKVMLSGRFLLIQAVFCLCLSVMIWDICKPAASSNATALTNPSCSIHALFRTSLLWKTPNQNIWDTSSRLLLWAHTVTHFTLSNTNLHQLKVHNFIKLLHEGERAKLGTVARWVAPAVPSQNQSSVPASKHVQEVLLVFLPVPDYHWEDILLCVAKKWTLRDAGNI